MLGDSNVLRGGQPILAGEDFAFYLERTPGAFLLFGQGEEDRFRVTPHNSYYEFNDNLLPIGASFFTRMVEQELG